MSDNNGSDKKRFCTNCGTQAIGNEKFCTNCGAQLPPMGNSGPASGAGPAGSPPGGGIPSGGTGTPPPGGTWKQPAYPNGSYPGNGQEKKKKSPVKLILIIAGVVIILLIAMTVMSGSEENGDSQAVEATETQAEAAGGETEEKLSEDEGKTEAAGSAEETEAEKEADAGRMTAYELYSALQDNEVAAFTLNEKTSAFLQDHDDLFPAASLEAVTGAGVVDESLEARQITKSPDRYGDRLMYLPELQVIQITEGEIDTDWYLTEINAIDMAGQQYYIFYEGTLDDIFENDWITAYALALGSTTFENTEGGETWTIPMAGSYVEKWDETGAAQAAAEPVQPVPETESQAASGGDAGMYQTMYVVNCNESITLRTEPSTKAAEICQIPLGAVVSYIEPAENGFYKVVYLGQTGYALASYLSF